MGFERVDLVTPEWLDAFHVYVATKAGGPATGDTPGSH